MRCAMQLDVLTCARQYDPRPKAKTSLQSLARDASQRVESEQSFHARTCLCSQGQSLSVRPSPNLLSSVVTTMRIFSCSLPGHRPQAGRDLRCDCARHRQIHHSHEGPGCPRHFKARDESCAAHSENVFRMTPSFLMVLANRP